VSVNDDASQSRIQNAAGLERPIAHRLFIGGKFGGDCS